MNESNPKPTVTAMRSPSAGDIIAATALALALLEKLLPAAQAAFNTGLITPVQQQAIRDKYASLRNLGDAAFSGPEWEA